MCTAPLGLVYRSKTTYLAARITDTARARGTGAIIAASFTKAAATEMASRGLPLPKDQVGTLHSLAYRAIDRPPVAAEQLTGWNNAYPNYRLTTNPTAMEDAVEIYSGPGHGDALMRQLDHCRARMLPDDLWSREVFHFHRAWEDWKAAAGGLVDFTDMIEIALRDTTEAPGSPVVGFFDECQDDTRLELALIRHWGKAMERIVMVGDDDQNLYSFRGATPDAFLDPPLPDEQKRVLTQSYRVPRAVHAAATQWVQRLSRREPKEYQPRDADGSVTLADHTYHYPEPLVEEIHEVLATTDQTIMVMGACSYMIDPLKHRLRATGTAFSNPWRRTRGDWNPLTPSKGVSASERLIAYLIIDERLFGTRSRLWTATDMHLWMAAIKADGVFVRGAKKRIDDLAAQKVGEVPYETIEALFASPEEMAAALEPSLAWFTDHLLGTKTPTMAFPLRVAERSGPGALIDPPRVFIGTTHSFKGSQADRCYLFPDLSLAGAQEWGCGGEAADAVIRQMYVGMTRAKSDLVVCSPVNSALAVDPQLLTGAPR